MLSSMIRSFDASQGHDMSTRGWYTRNLVRDGEQTLVAGVTGEEQDSAESGGGGRYQTETECGHTINCLELGLGGEGCSQR
jgi:hypothetical protein